MKKTKPDIQLVITAALKKELPMEWLKAHAVPVHTLAALKSGALDKLSGNQPAILVIITGAGLEAGREAACWIRDNLIPLFVVNIGTCGVIDKRRPLARWIRPESVCDEDGDQIELDSRFPFEGLERASPVNSLLSAAKAQTGRFPGSWRKYDAVDMECFAQAQVLSTTGITLHCLKFCTDYSDGNTVSDFNQNIERFRKEVITLFSAILSLDSESEPGKPLKVSVVIPVYNREQTIRHAVDSVLSQSFPPEEVIVADDGSNDATPDILKAYGSSIAVITLPVNSGVSRARNEGIARARSEWVAFLDSDDCWKPDKLERQIEYLKRRPFYLILQSDEIWIRNGKRVNPCKHHAKPEGWIWEASLERCLVSPSGVLVRKSLLEKYGNFDETLPVCEDYDLWLKISRHHPVGLEPGLSVIKYGGHGDQLSRKYPAIDRFRVQSLSGLLQHEGHPYYRKKIIEVLRRKLKILIQGYAKRGRTADAEECKRVIEVISNQ